MWINFIIISYTADLLTKKQIAEIDLSKQGIFNLIISDPKELWPSETLHINFMSYKTMVYDVYWAWAPSSVWVSRCRDDPNTPYRLQNGTLSDF